MNKTQQTEHKNQEGEVKRLDLNLEGDQEEVFWGFLLKDL